MAVGDTILIKDISINGNNKLKKASDLSKELTDNTINAFGIDASSRTIWVNGQPYGNAYVNIKEDKTTIEAPIGAEIFNDFEHNIASGEYSHAEGNSSKAKGASSHAEGNSTNALGESSHAEGQGIVSGRYIFTGPDPQNEKLYQAQYTNGLEIGDILIRESDNYAVYITAIDGNNITFNNTFGPINNQHLKKITGSFGQFSHSEGNETIANEHAAHAEGFGTKAFGENSHAEGEKSKSFGKDSHSEGSNTVAAGKNSHAEGADSTAGGPSSHAEGFNTQAKSAQSHAEGYGTIIAGDIEVDGMWLGPTASHAEGYLTKVIAQGKEGGLIANGQAAHVEGYMTEAHNLGEHAEGRLNVSHYVTPQNASNPTKIELSQSTLHSVGMGFPDPNNPEVVNRMNAHEIMQDGKHYIYGIGGYKGTNPENSKDIATYLPNMVNITYKELVDLRKESNLVPGQQYRITDYTCTTGQEFTQSANHPFDIIVTADSKNKLNEKARAINHTFDNPEDDHFKYCNLAAWKLWYCIDNDISRFYWSDYNGKGVIYRMIDEWNNDCPYDFKNIQYYGDWGYWAYTFNWINDNSDNTCEDLSVKQYGHTNDEGGYTHIHTYGNVIKPCEYVYGGYGFQLQLNACVFLNTESFGSGNFYSCYYNTFGNNCYSNTFSNNCYYNTFGNGCSNNTFSNDCYFNSFGNYCSYNILGNNYSNNSFGNSCHDIKFVSDSDDSTFTNYYRNNHFGDGCEYILFKASETASSNNQIQNYKFAQGTSNITIVGKRNRAYETYISKDTDGIVKESIIAEKLDKMIEIKYKELVNLRDSDGLVPGQQYRITDYICTTVQDGTRSANNMFDIIVTADSNSKLNEEARAINHDFNKPGADYFNESNLTAWKLWYCLDNDTNRFAWADQTNGKGVIYRMIDEWNNDCPYDFKNIQFYRKWNETMSFWSIISSANDGGEPCYTFSSWKNGSTTTGSTKDFTDYSLKKSNNVYSNVIKVYITYLEHKQTLNNICFFGISCYNNSFGNNCYNNTFYDLCSNNTFGNNCNSNIFLSQCSYNSFGNYCTNNTIGQLSQYNSFGNNCEYIKFASNLKDDQSSEYYNKYLNNHFGDGCKYIIFNEQSDESMKTYFIQNYKFAQGVQGTLDAGLHIWGIRNRSFETKVAKDSNKNLKIYCEADLVPNK